MRECGRRGLWKTEWRLCLLKKQKKNKATDHISIYYNVDRQDKANYLPHHREIHCAILIVLHCAEKEACFILIHPGSAGTDRCRFYLELLDLFIDILPPFKGYYFPSPVHLGQNKMLLSYLVIRIDKRKKQQTPSPRSMRPCDASRWLCVFSLSDWPLNYPWLKIHQMRADD